MRQKGLGKVKTFKYELKVNDDGNLTNTNSCRILIHTFGLVSIELVLFNKFYHLVF
jgi:hypothetical protein